MRRTHGRLVATVGVALLVLSLAGTGLAQPSTTTADQTTVAETNEAQTDSTDTITQTQRYSLTADQPGEVDATFTYDLPDRVTALRTTIPDNVTVAETDGFDRLNATHYEWDGNTESPTMDLTYNPNETTDRSGFNTGAGEYIFVDAGSWALFRGLRMPTGYSYTETGDTPVTFERTISTAGAGVAGDRLVYLGPSTTVERTANDQTFRLVIPDSAELTEPRADILDSLANASRSLQVDDRDETVTGFAAPTDRIDWGLRGLEYGGADFWVRDFERLDTASNVWLHEYVHTRQSFSTTSETRWLTEASATYYGALLTLEQDRIDFSAFSSLLTRGESSSYDSVTLSDPSTWTNNANYVKGALVTGRIDEALREETDKTGTFEQTFQRLNGVSGELTQSQFLNAVETTGGSDSRTTADDYTSTDTSASMWSDATHQRLFGPLPASVSYLLPNSTAGYRATGPYRNETVTTPVRLATGETLTVGTVVRNTGDAAGEYNATLTVDDTPVASSTGTVDAETDETVSLSHTFDDAGTYALGVGDEQTTVTVDPPAEPNVTSLSAASTTVQRGNNTTVTATVENDAAVPANGTVVFTRDDQPVATRAVTLAPGARTNLSVSVSFPETGEVRLGAGSADPITVTVVAPASGFGPGFTVPAAILAIVLALFVRSRRNN